MYSQKIFNAKFYAGHKKNGHLEKLAVSVLKFEQWFYDREMHPKEGDILEADDMANSVHPDQTAIP